MSTRSPDPNAPDYSAADPDAAPPTPSGGGAAGHANPRANPHANPKQDPHPGSNTEKDPDDWVSGDEPMTGAQASYLTTLSEEAHAEPPPDTLTKAEASRRIDALKDALGR